MFQPRFPHAAASLSMLAGAAAIMLAPPAAAQVEPHPLMLRYPDVSRDHIVFCYANDLWLVSRAGGDAWPLASPPGQETFPRFSPDGKTIAFVGNYDGNRDLYTISIDGGVPVRVTYHPSTEVLSDWTPDGRLLFWANGFGGLMRQTQLFTVDAAGGLPAKLPPPYGANGAISGDGHWLAYTPHSIDNRTWKRYRGGMATDIWLFNLIDKTAERITDWEGTDTQPMWFNGGLCYLSDAGPQHRLNIWSYNTSTGEREQVTTFADFDVKWPSIGSREIVFQNGPELFLLDLRTKLARIVEVTIPGDRPTMRTKRVDDSKFTRWWNISPTGKRALAEARGDVWTLPAENGSPRNLTRTSGAAERDPSWSPDGRWIAYFSDESGEYELYVKQSDGKGETRQLTSGSQTFYSDPLWSPDSKHIVFTDKASKGYLHTIATGETKVIDKDPWGFNSRPSWSHDSRWIAYARTEDRKPISAIWLYNLESGEKQKATSGMFNDTSPAFDRKGDYLYFASSRTFQPTYSDIDTTFIYNQGQVLLAVPLRTDVKSPYLPKSDEETWKDEAADKEKDKDKDAAGAAPAGGDDDDGEADDEGDADDADDADDDADDADDEGNGDDQDGDDDDEAAPAADDGVSGTWEGTLSGAALPPELQGASFTMVITLAPDGTLTGSISVPMGTAELSGTYDKASGQIDATVTTPEGQAMKMTGRISGTSFTATVVNEADGLTVEMTGSRTAAASAGGDGADKGKAKGKDKPREVVEIVVAGFEARAFALPVKSGNFATLAVNDRNQLLYARQSPNGPAEIMLFDLDDDKKEEKSVAKGANGFEISADGKQLILLRDGGASIQAASAGATPKNVVTAGMDAFIEPRQEWRQIFIEAWRLQRDFFYVENLHGVDWSAVRYNYEKMLDDCVTREDVSYVIREMISELNIGHAYYFGGDEEPEPAVAVGLLGVDWELDGGAYRIKGICHGAAWDVDARNPLDEPGVDVVAGDYVLAVNGVPIDVTKDPRAAFVGTAGRTITITVSKKPQIDGDARDVAVRPIGAEAALRYREWIEGRRAAVDAATGGRVGYIYVPNTGVEGQNDLFRQFYGQLDKQALIIDERWNGGGQIPTRFIELLNRPVTNYWARRDHQDWTWPPDSHQGPKCMLINGLAGSGGDMLPWLFKQAGLGKLIGMRTWGGLVGISGNPQLIDGGGITVPTFGFYEKDGSWGVEGHGVDPDIVVIDDPALMADGGDPQLDAAIRHMLAEIEAHPYVPPKRPEAPDRSGMGIRDEDR